MLRVVVWEAQLCKSLKADDEYFLDVRHGASCTILLFLFSFPFFSLWPSYCFSEKRVTCLNLFLGRKLQLRDWTGTFNAWHYLKTLNIVHYFIST